MPACYKLNAKFVGWYLGHVNNLCKKSKIFFKINSYTIKINSFLSFHLTNFSINSNKFKLTNECVWKYILYLLKICLHVKLDHCAIVSWRQFMNFLNRHFPEECKEAIPSLIKKNWTKKGIIYNCFYYLKTKIIILNLRFKF